MPPEPQSFPRLRVVHGDTQFVGASFVHGLGLPAGWVMDWVGLGWVELSWVEIYYLLMGWVGS